MGFWCVFWLLANQMKCDSRSENWPIDEFARIELHASSMKPANLASRLMARPFIIIEPTNIYTNTSCVVASCKLQVAFGDTISTGNYVQITNQTTK